jgi:hypothetical protein
MSHGAVSATLLCMMAVSIKVRPGPVAGYYEHVNKPKGSERSYECLE